MLLLSVPSPRGWYCGDSPRADYATETRGESGVPLTEMPVIARAAIWGKTSAIADENVSLSKRLFLLATRL
jgi:hypothetical protein